MNPVEQLFVHRDKLFSLVSKNLKSKFAGSALGFLWAFLNPLLLALIVSYVFTHIFQTQEKNLPLFIIAGILPWAFFAGSLQEAAVSIPSQASLLKQFSLPREFIPLSCVLTNFIFLLWGLLVMAPFFAAADDSVIMRLPWLMGVLFLHLLFTGGLSLMLSAAYVSFRDVSQILNTVMMLWLWLTPVFFSTEMMSKENRILFEWNPVTPFIHLYRSALLGTDGGAQWFIPAAFFALISISLGYISFYKNEKNFLKRI